MKNEKGRIELARVFLTTLLIIILVFCFNVYRKNYFNGFEKGVVEKATKVKFVRDSEVKYSDSWSYKIENIEYGDSTFYKEIEVEPNTMYRISCMVKTEGIKCEVANEDGGATIGLLETTEYSEPITGTNEWQLVEYMFNSKNRTKVKISFRLGGNTNNCVGTAWFSDFKLEKGTKDNDGQWNMACFIINELDVNIDGRQYKFNISTSDIDNVKSNLERFKDDCYRFSDKRMHVNYEIIGVNTPVKTISYSEEHGYYVSYLDVKDLIYDTVREKEYDHVFVVCRMEDEEGKISIPVKDKWIGLGSMDMYGIGYSLVRINKNSNTYTYRYGITNQSPEEVYLHEFLHTLERNSRELGYSVPDLHDHAKYGYTEKTVVGLEQWYNDYMSKTILDESIGHYVGLCDACYNTQPPNKSNFRYPLEIEFNTEPQNIFEEILTIFKTLGKIF